MTDMRFPFFLLCLLSGWFNTAHALPAAPALGAKHYALYDAGSGQMLVSEAAHEHIAPGSLTKLMTAYVVFGALRDGEITLRQHVTPTQYALRPQHKEPRMFLQSGQDVSVDDLLHGLIVQSANDAARVLAEAVAHHELAFVDRMNATAQRLGLSDSHFANASGVDETGQYSSAHDLVLLAAALLRDFPDFIPRYAQRQYTYNGIEQYSHNRLLWLDPNVDGLQTAQVDGLGFSSASSARRGQRRLLAVVIGAATASLRDSDSQRLLNHGFREYEAVLLYRERQPVQTVRVWKGTEDRLDIGFAADLYVTVPAGTRERLRARLETAVPLVAPINREQPVGILHLLLDGEPLLDAPVIALQRVPLANVFARGVDAIRLLFN
ncbi:D-alanyl-D-alanine carboxypeptidase family protein [Ferrigenium sp. UT5]|uniref:D-alanyl-D-alanine carboxypeptidase family protein n=1 Tax=Ferrigenium sp. UT5 TaxID=3242105 RepID=UPI00354DE8FF